MVGFHSIELNSNEDMISYPLMYFFGGGNCRVSSCGDKDSRLFRSLRKIKNVDGRATVVIIFELCFLMSQSIFQGIH